MNRWPGRNERKKILRKIISGERPLPVVSKSPEVAAKPPPNKASQAAPPSMVFDARSERNLKSLQPHAEARFREWLQAVRKAGIPAVIICGTRTFAEQADIYAQGRTKPGSIVTKAAPGDSMHNYGVAIDFVVFDGVDAHGGTGQPKWDSPLMAKAGQIALEMGLDWGGAWKTFKDTPHIQLPGLRIANLRQLLPHGWMPA
jgi:peptidoglycan L-alanyl-D-glutamate endopeptidase CwlK